MRDADHEFLRRNGLEGPVSSPICQRRVTLGDGENFFKAAIDQAGVLSGQAAGSAAAAGKSAN